MIPAAAIARLEELARHVPAVVPPEWTALAHPARTRRHVERLWRDYAEAIRTRDDLDDHCLDWRERWDPEDLPSPRQESAIAVTDQEAEDILRALTRAPLTTSRAAA